MLAHEPYLEPYVDDWEEDKKPRLIELTIYEICSDICRRGRDAIHSAEFDVLYNYIEENLEKYLPEPDLY